MALKKEFVLVLLLLCSKAYCLENANDQSNTQTQVLLQVVSQRSETPPPDYLPAPPAYGAFHANAHDTLPSYHEAVSYTRRINKCDYVAFGAAQTVSLAVTGGGVYLYRALALDPSDATLSLIAGIAVGVGALGMGLSFLGLCIKCTNDRTRIRQLNAAMINQYYAGMV